MQAKSIVEGEHSAILSTSIKLPVNIAFVIKIFFVSIFEWPFYKGFTISEIYKISELQLMYCFFHTE